MGGGGARWKEVLVAGVIKMGGGEAVGGCGSNV